jgi:hypothetical protein
MKSSEHGESRQQGSSQKQGQVRQGKGGRCVAKGAAAGSGRGSHELRSIIACMIARLCSRQMVIESGLFAAGPFSHGQSIRWLHMAPRNSKLRKQSRPPAGPISMS